MMQNLRDIQRAHDILCPVASGELKLRIDASTRQSLHAAHDALAWVLGFECGEAFETSLKAVLDEARREGYGFEEKS